MQCNAILGMYVWAYCNENWLVQRTFNLRHLYFIPTPIILNKHVTLNIFLL